MHMYIQVHGSLLINFEMSLKTKVAYSGEVTSKFCRSSTVLIVEQFWTISLIVASVRPDNTPAPTRTEAGSVLRILVLSSISFA